ncbi:MAG: diguanylate cyclase [Firmicutes bacterium]|nr:diguanylate cyclase [Bacillota bacterium]
MKEIAGVLKAHVRSEDKVIRFGGDEFLLLLEDCSPETAEKVLTRVNQALQANSKFAFPIELSYGIAVVRGKGELLQAIHTADVEMYKLKASAACPGFPEGIEAIFCRRKQKNFEVRT